MKGPDFTFKQFSVWHDKCAMKVGTDAVLLGAWVNVENASSILDVGTGSGIITLMCAQRSSAILDAVEIDAGAYEQAQENFRRSAWSDRITAHHKSFGDFARESQNKYDVIVSNPPFFRNSLKPPDLFRSAARHDDQLSYDSLLMLSYEVCSENGNLAVIIPANDTEFFVSIALMNGFYIRRKTSVCSHHGKRPVRSLLEFSKTGASDCIETTISIRKEGSNEYSGEYIRLTQEYYLHMS